MKKQKIFLTIISSFILTFSSCSGDKPAPAHVHTFSDEWTYDSTEHWHASTCGHDVTSGNATHEFGEWIIDEEAEPHKKGLKHHTCTICEYIAYETFSYVIYPTQVYIPTHSASLFTGYTYSLSPIVIPNDSYKNIKYVVDKESVLSIENDTVLGLNPGNSIIHIYNDNNDNDIMDVDEPYAVTAFSIVDPDPNVVITVNNGNPITLNVGSNKTVSVSVSGGTPSGFDYGYYSENEDICTIAGGKLMAHRAGSTRISVSWKGYRGYCSVTVNDLIDSVGLRASSIELDEGNIILNKGENHEILSHLLPVGTVDTIKSYSSNNERAAQVDSNGVITAISGGSAIITLTSTNNLIKRILVVVKDPQEDEANYYNNYYGDLTWENGDDLLNKLHTIISKDVNHIAYVKGSSNNNWDSNKDADHDLYDPNYVYAVYSDNPILKDSTYSSWQREHAFAASLMTGYSTGDAVLAKGRATDFHNLFAASSGANGSRGNKNYGYADPTLAGYNTKENCAYRKNAWEPDDADKGRLARAIFYMGVMYNETEEVSIKEKWTFDKTNDPSVMNETKSSKTVDIKGNEKAINIIEDDVGYNKIGLDTFMYPLTEQDITLVNYYRDLVRIEDPDLENDDYNQFRIRAYEIYTDNSVAYSIGHLSDLLKWNSFDVDLQEMQHNESVYTYNASTYGGVQGNRNPFVDYPQLVDYVYGDLKEESGSIHDLIPSYLTLEMNKDEVHHYAYDSSNIVSYAVGESPNLNDFPIKAIKKDLSEGTVDPTKVSIDEYTFVEEDVENGKDIVIHTDINDIPVHVNVTSQSVVKFDDCTYHYKATAGIKDNFTDPEGEKIYTGTQYVATLNNTIFDVTLGQNNSTTFNNITSGGVTIGSTTAGKEINTFTIETRESYNNINAAYFYGAPSAKATITYKIYVGSTEVYSGSTDGTSTILEYGGMFAAVTGKMKIVVTCKGIKFAGIAFNYAVE